MRALDLDRRLLVLARTRGHTPGLERGVRTVSAAGEHAACWLTLGLAGALLERARPERRAGWVRGAERVAFAYAFNTALKVTVHRRRPSLPGLPPLVATPTQLSFPSAHATTSFAAARAYAGLAPRRALYGAAGVLAISRVYLGVHHPSDVLGGALLGAAIGGRG